MKQRPILFSTEMVQAILAGRKTQTRRVVKFKDHQPTVELNFLPSAYPHFQFQSGNRHWQAECPYGKPGDVLWVRETWARAIGSEQVTTSEKATAVEISPERFIVFKADSKEETHPEHPEWGKKRWNPSIHMPKDAARIWLRIKDVRVDRLQDISEDDAIAEGCSKYGPFGEYKGSLHPNGGSMKYRAYSNPIDAFKCVWESINGEQSWKSNPWVWVVEFDRIEKPEL